MPASTGFHAAELIEQNEVGNTLRALQTIPQLLVHKRQRIRRKGVGNPVGASMPCGEGQPGLLRVATGQWQEVIAIGPRSRCVAHTGGNLGEAIHTKPLGASPLGQFDEAGRLPGSRGTFKSNQEHN